MALNYALGSKPDGTSPNVMRGTAVHLIKSLMKSARCVKGGKVEYDYLWVSQMAGCLGISQEEADVLLAKVQKGQAPESVIDNFMKAKISLKEETISEMKDKLREMK